MGSLIVAINTADRIARMWLDGAVDALTATELLNDLGFAHVGIGERRMHGFYNGVRFELPGDATVRAT